MDQFSKLEMFDDSKDSKASVHKAKGNPMFLISLLIALGVIVSVMVMNFRA